MPTASLVSGLIEHSINYWLKTSGHNSSAPKKLTGKIFAIELTDLSLVLVMQINEQGLLNVYSPLEGSADCTIKTSLAGLQKLQQPEQITALIKAGEVDIDGDVSLAQQFSDWLKGSLIYWQDILASFTGDIAAHHLSEIAQQTKQLASQKSADAKRIFSHIVWDEKRLAPNPLELEEFATQVQQTRQAADRLSAKIQQLTQKIEAKS
ncbi:SCP2 sterol-binding domain-containing protein [Catenovulum sp. 2E275]|uniref:ubiquinone biosynthesis accessory factor UbiJ n=1 Tax=Catenovulum sp. 2E275 TaxID=2980497 RepID=UPI0021D3822B|nr:SCP2 sterol-binding domain-containing protein [Catenovulum sp. 2E275]MCU4675182.1 SCP2 sterol-binding domain-containing protein [Catenovulum sp. 2E275]